MNDNYRLEPFATDRKKPQRFNPTPLQVRYRMARMDALSTGHGVTDAPIAAILNCRAATISTWKRNPDFVSWLAAEERRVLDHLWGVILLRAAQLALQGSVEHLRLLAQTRGELTKGGQPPVARAEVSVVVEVPPVTAPGI